MERSGKSLVLAVAAVEDGGGDGESVSVAGLSGSSGDMLLEPSSEIEADSDLSSALSCSSSALSCSRRIALFLACRLSRTEMSANIF